MTSKLQEHREALLRGETFWRDKYQWFLDAGYRLRPRYHPDWVPSWKVNPRLNPIFCEDAIINYLPVICDAVQIKNETQVILKRVSLEGPDEIGIHEYLTQEPRKSDTKNHCIPLIEVLQHPDDQSEKVIVLPLCRAWDSPPFETCGEVVDCIRQILEGVQFIHENRIAHRDIKSRNIMMDRSLFTIPFHPIAPLKNVNGQSTSHASYTRTQRRPRYYIIDYGLAHQYEESQMPPFEITGVFGSDQTVPEFQSLDEPHNPFPIDIYCLGNLLQNDILCEEAQQLGFGWLLPLIKDMTDTDPTKRPLISDVVSRFEEGVSALSKSSLRAKFAPLWDEFDWYEKLTTTVPYWLRRITFVLTRTPAIPVEKASRDGK